MREKSIRIKNVHCISHKAFYGKNLFCNTECSTEFDIYQLMHFLYNNLLVYNVNIKTLKNT